MKKTGLIFDMDGVIVDNYRYHCRAWIRFAKKYGYSVSFEEVKSWFGRINSEILKDLFENNIEEEEIEKYAAEKEQIYREIYKEHITELQGLSSFLSTLKNEDFQMALATSAPKENVEFVLDNTGLKDKFLIITDASEISKGKPDPEIFLKTAHKMGIDPGRCIVFEDSIHGITAARAAGMKVIGVASSHGEEFLKGTVLNIIDFTGITKENLMKIMDL